MCTIGIDCRFAATRSGLGRYTRELVTHLLPLPGEKSYVLFLSVKDDRQWLQGIGSKNYQLKTTNSLHYSLSEQLMFPRTLKHSHIDLFFSPHFNVPYFCPVPFVATIHDLILHHYPNQASALRRMAYERLMQRTVKNAGHLIAVSAFTCDELTKMYGREIAKKTSVIHEAAGDMFHAKLPASSAGVLKKYQLRKPFFLYVGNAKQHKNIQMLIDAYRSLGTKETELVLVTSGPEVDSLQLTDGVRILREVSDDDLPCLYHFAVSFVTASLYEGFCLPIVEAAACGCAVIATNRGSIPEVAPEGSLLIEPTVEEIAEALRSPPEAHTSPHSRTWSDVAKETADIFDQTLQSV